MPRVPVRDAVEQAYQETYDVVAYWDELLLGEQWGLVVSIAEGYCGWMVLQDIGPETTVGELIALMEAA